MYRATAASFGSSPHTRGAHQDFRDGRHTKGIIPAYAGSTPFARSCPRSAGDHPRIRGEHSATSSYSFSHSGSSPHTRGAHQIRLRRDQRRRIIPAYAGSTGPGGCGRPDGRDHPRIRGEHNPDTPGRRYPGGSSPHTRGAPDVRVVVFDSETDHPRIRGEHPDLAGRRRLGEGSSPHTRGARGIAAVVGGPEGIIPAYAGSTSRTISHERQDWDHPRIRGEHERPVAGWGGWQGSSPHTRGAPEALYSHDLLGRIIPAYAGSTISTRPETRPPPDHPRIRGEHGAVGEYSLQRRGSSPHTRGARSRRACRRVFPGIIPAYAGSTPCGTMILTECRDHPRIRGEHSCSSAGVR